MTLLQHHVLALSLTAMTTLGLGLIVFLANPKKRLNQIFGLYSLSIAWWAAPEALTVGTNSQAVANAASFITWIGVIFIAPTFLHTVFLSTGATSKTAKAALLGFYLVSGVFLAFHLTRLLTLPPRPVYQIAHVAS
ncbi:MAG TPA: hypothetical protein DDX89_03400, partial [Candidatus Omnitrophica bacterium]|nr:hypothetical protein [Candidatus Omnitrophota bacterium]